MTRVRHASALGPVSGTRRVPRGGQASSVARPAAVRRGIRTEAPQATQSSLDEKPQSQSCSMRAASPRRHRAARSRRLPPPNLLGDRKPKPALLEPDSETWAPAEGEITQRAPARIIGQGERARLAEDAARLLALVDDTPEVDRRRWQESWDTELTRFLSLRARARGTRTAIPEARRRRGVPRRGGALGVAAVLSQ